MLQGLVQDLGNGPHRKPLLYSANLDGAALAKSGRLAVHTHVGHRALLPRVARPRSTASDTAGTDAPDSSPAQAPPAKPAVQKSDPLSASDVNLGQLHVTGKDTDMNEEDARDIMFQQYEGMRDKVFDEVPSDVKILKHILNLDSIAERKTALEEAFTQGPDYVDGDIEYLSTTPDDLLLTVDQLLIAIERTRRKVAEKRGLVDAFGGSLKDVGGIEILAGMQARAETVEAPRLIERLYELRVLIRRDFMIGRGLDDIDRALGWRLGIGDGTGDGDGGRNSIRAP